MVFGGIPWCILLLWRCPWCNCYYGGARGVIVIVVGTGHDNTSSSPGQH